jgi:uncharacterized membrane protein
MRKVWKWIIGIVIGLVILAVLVGGVLLVRNGFHAGRERMGYSQAWSQPGPGMMPYGGFGYNRRGPGMMYGFGMMPFGGLFGILFSLGFLAFVVLGIVWLVQYIRRPKTATGTTSVPVSSEPAIAMTACKKCGRQIQADWNNCPYCGKKV